MRAIALLFGEGTRVVWREDGQLYVYRRHYVDDDGTDISLDFKLENVNEVYINVLQTDGSGAARTADFETVWQHPLANVGFGLPRSGYFYRNYFRKYLMTEEAVKTQDEEATRADELPSAPGICSHDTALVPLVSIA